MASIVLYPPIVDSQMKAFTGSDCNVYFSLSKFNSSSDFKTVQISVTEQITNKNYVNIKDNLSNGKYRATGIILNVIPQVISDEENLFKVTINSSDVSPDGGSTIGWEIGKTYKIQLRLSAVDPLSGEKINQAEWLKQHAGEFSEWSTVCIVKATSKIDYKINAGSVTIDSRKKDSTSASIIQTLDISTLELVGNFIRTVEDDHDPSEFVKSYQFLLYDADDALIEDSGLIYTENNENNIDKIQYLCKTELENEHTYKLSFKFESEHGYTDGFYKTEDEEGVIDHRFVFQASQITVDPSPAFIITADNAEDYHDELLTPRFRDVDETKIHTHKNRYDYNYDILSPFDSPSGEDSPEIIDYSDLTVDQFPLDGQIGYIYLGKKGDDIVPYIWNGTYQESNVLREGRIMTGLTTVDEEEDEGRIGLKFYSTSPNPYSGNLCIRRSDSRTNFKIWTDIYIYVCTQENINDIPVIYDYTIESGVWYKYAVQLIDRDGRRGIIQQDRITPARIRNFNYSFLLGKNNRQLKLQFDNTMSNYKYQIMESKIDPINSVFPIVTRNAATKYKTFPINGLISFMMDEDNHTFTNRTEVYGNRDIASLYQTYNDNNNIKIYDYTYEREYRNKILDFLYDGDFKLFKSPTEGNVIVRLMDINCTPVQSLDRMLYSFTATAYEMADASMENLRKYGFYDPGTYASDFTTYSTNIGQIQMNVPINQVDEKGNKIIVNIIEEIYKKYDTKRKGKGQSEGGFIKKIGDVYCLKITFDGKPMKVYNYSGSDTDGTITLGYTFSYNQQHITVHSPHNIYEFDEKIHFNPKKDSIIIEEDVDRKKQFVSITVDFLYEIAVETWQGRRIARLSTKTNLGEFFEECVPGKDIYSEIYWKYNIDWFTTSHKDFRRLNRISSIEIEANPGTVMWISDDSDEEFTGDDFKIGDTGKLRLHELSNILGLKYKGIEKPDGTIDETRSQDILVNYEAVIYEGIWKDEQ